MNSISPYLVKVSSLSHIDERANFFEFFSNFVGIDKHVLLREDLFGNWEDPAWDWQLVCVPSTRRRLLTGTTTAWSRSAGLLDGERPMAALSASVLVDLGPRIEKTLASVLEDL